MKIDRLFVVSLGAITGLASCSSGQEEEAAKTEYPDPARG